MKTLICIPCLLTGGTEIQTLNTVHALVEGGHEVTVACYFEHTPEMEARYRKAGAEVILFSPEGVRVGGYKSFLFLYKHLRRAVRAVRPDVVHVQYMAPGATVILLLWLMGVKNIIATAHTAADIYRDLRLIHFLQRHCLRAFTCITERAERSFFGSSQLYTPDMVLGRRNHFTIYNALPKATVLQTTDNGQQTRFVPMSENQVRLNSHSECSQSSTTKLLTDSHPEENTKHSTLNATQDNSHADCTDYTENASLAGNINLTQTSQNSRNNISEQDNQRELDTITQNTHCYARVGHPEGDDAAEQQVNCDDSQVNVASPRLGVNQSQSDDSPATPLRFTSSSAAINRSEAAFTLGVVSRLELIKGMDLVVPAFAEVLKAYPETQLLVVGDGTLRASMEEQAAQLACADHIRFVGRQPQEELSQWYSQMDIVLMPSRSEGFGLTAIEAMAHGCVMVASDVGGLPEVVRDGICGLLHRTEDVADMASKISTLIGDPALYTQLRAQSLVEVEKYSFERYASAVCDLYKRLGFSV